MQCRIVQCCIVQCHTVQCHTVQCHTVQCHTVLCSAVKCSAVQCSLVFCSTVPCISGQFITAQWCGTGQNLTLLICLFHSKQLNDLNDITRFAYRKLYFSSSEICHQTVNNSVLAEYVRPSYQRWRTVILRVFAVQGEDKHLTRSGYTPTHTCIHLLIHKYTYTYMHTPPHT